MGDNFAVTIRGAANSPVTNTASQNGQSLGTAAYGSTDGQGQRVITGTMTPGTEGAWSETWTVGGASAGSLNFSVAGAAGAGAGGSGGGGTGSGDKTTTVTPPATGGGLTSTVSLGGVDIPVWLIAAAVVAVGSGAFKK